MRISGLDSAWTTVNGWISDGMHESVRLVCVSDGEKLGSWPLGDSPPTRDEIEAAARAHADGAESVRLYRILGRVLTGGRGNHSASFRIEPDGQDQATTAAPPPPGIGLAGALGHTSIAQGRSLEALAAAVVTTLTEQRTYSSHLESHSLALVDRLAVAVQEGAAGKVQLLQAQLDRALAENAAAAALGQGLVPLVAGPLSALSTAAAEWIQAKAIEVRDRQRKIVDVSSS